MVSKDMEQLELLHTTFINHFGKLTVNNKFKTYATIWLYRCTARYLTNRNLCASALKYIDNNSIICSGQNLEIIQMPIDFWMHIIWFHIEIQMNELLYSITWINLIHIMLSKWSQVHNNTYYIIEFI